MRLIGLSGFKTSGKDATYHAIQATLPGKNVQRVAFADKLKIAAARAIGLVDKAATEQWEHDESMIYAMDQCKEGWTFAVYDPAGNELNVFSGREYLQWFGTEAGREVFGQEFWVDLVLPIPDEISRGPLRSLEHEAKAFERNVTRALEDKYPGADVLVVTDARFPNEATRIKELGGEMWEIVRPGLQGDGHASEISLPDALVDYTIVNDGTLDDLAEKVKDTLYSRV
jgi:hypothetical protein